MKSGLVLGAALLVTLGGAACSESPLTPTSPTDSPFVTQFSGVWDGSLELTGASGGECVGSDLLAGQFAAPAGPQSDVGTVAITQSGTEVTAIVRSTTTGLACEYRGIASLQSFTLNAESCVEEIFFQCSNLESRVLEPIGSTITVRRSADLTTGTVSSSFNVYDPDMTPVAGLTQQHQFTAARRR
jgi:hypothetical protein